MHSLSALPTGDAPTAERETKNSVAVNKIFVPVLQGGNKAPFGVKGAGVTNRVRKPCSYSLTKAASFLAFLFVMLAILRET